MAVNGGDKAGGDRPALSRRFLEELIFSFDGSRRFTQDSPVLPDVWLYYGCQDPLGALDLLLTPHHGTRAGALARRLRSDRLLGYRGKCQVRLWTGGERAPARIAYTHANVAARLYFDELVRVVLPMTAWWRGMLKPQPPVTGAGPAAARGAETAAGGKGTKSPSASKAAAKTAAMKSYLRATELADSGRPIAALRERLEERDVRRAFHDALDKVFRLARSRASGGRNEPPPDGLTPPGVRPEMFWMAGVIGAIAWTARHAAESEGKRRGDGESDGCEVDLTGAAALTALDELLAGALEHPPPPKKPTKGAQRAGGAAEELERVYLINRNRPAGTAVTDSGPAIKADAARLLFNIDCSNLTWAMIDSGVDATHPAFHLRTADDHAPVPRKQPGKRPPDKLFGFESRVIKTYDFTRLRELLDPERLDPASEDGVLPAHVRDAIEAGRTAAEESPERKRADRLTRNLGALRELLEQGRELDWTLYEDLLEMPHDHPYYERPNPAFDHGTHVAGILAADWWKEDKKKGAMKSEMQGICPDLRLYDLRVLGPRQDDGDDELATRGGEEFVVIAALQFIRYLNESRDYIVVHGANLSLSINHDIANYACGRTPVCEECERLVDAGVTVVAAAGNQGYLRYQTHQGFKEGYHTISITDPGNAESVITVGATHRDRPHTYGVSYFSSRGPTGDGRAKPDLVAPGEKVTAPLPGGSSGRKDGTSMAAPHVSGAAALLMARYDELVGEPRRVKELICSTATDLGRERYFQGAGMLDVLRAMQAQ
jgi:subtilisin family serine protease